MYTRARPHPGGGNTRHPLPATLSPKRAQMGDARAPIVGRLLLAPGAGLVRVDSLEVEDAGGVVLVLRP